MTRTTAEFLLNVLASINLNVGDPNFDAMVANCQRAKAELREILSVPMTDREAFDILTTPQPKPTEGNPVA